jgi:hypothetical protein
MYNYKYHTALPHNIRTATTAMHNYEYRTALQHNIRTATTGIAHQEVQHTTRGRALSMPNISGVSRPVQVGHWPRVALTRGRLQHHLLFYLSIFIKTFLGFFWQCRMSSKSFFRHYLLWHDCCMYNMYVYVAGRKRGEICHSKSCVMIKF